VLIADNSESAVPKMRQRWGSAARRGTGGSRKAVATHGHGAPAAERRAPFAELTVGWHLVRLLGTQQPVSRVVYSTITELLPK